jgi:hypothetical protein
VGLDRVAAGPRGVPGGLVRVLSPDLNVVLNERLIARLVRLWIFRLDKQLGKTPVDGHDRLATRSGRVVLAAVGGTGY